MTEPNMSFDFDEPLVKDMPYLTRAYLCKLLNLESIVGHGDYKTLAGLMGMTTPDIQTISMSNNPADALLSWWETKISIATVAKLRELLLGPRMNREDLVGILDWSASTEKVCLNETAEGASEASTSSNVVKSGSANVRETKSASQREQQIQIEQDLVDRGDASSSDKAESSKSGSSAVGEARSENPKDSVPKTLSVAACSGCSRGFGQLLSGSPGRAYEKNPSVFPVLSDEEILGTGFVLQLQNKCYVISPSIPSKQCYARIPVQNEFQNVRLVPGTENNNLVVTSLKEDSSMLKLSVASEDSLDNGKKIYMVSRLARCRTCEKFQTKWLSKSCRVKSSGEGYNKKGGPFKDFPRGAPVVNRKNEVVGIIKSNETDGRYFEVAAIDMSELKQRGVTLLKDQATTTNSSNCASTITSVLVSN